MTIMRPAGLSSRSKGPTREPVEREGYTTTAAYQHGPQYEWVCVTCFQDFKAEMGWTEV